MEAIVIATILILSICDAVGAAEKVVNIDNNWPYGLYYKTWLGHHSINDLQVKEDESLTPYRITNIKYDASNVEDQKAFQTKIKSIYEKGYTKIRDTTIIPFINELKTENLIGFAVPHTVKPVGVSEMYNIEFDHIPPDSSYRFGAEYGPSMAISNFDHRSKLWRGCSTGKAPMHDLYKHFMQPSRNYYCAIYTNLKCIRDYERTLHPNEKINPHEEAFQRYKEGIKGLVGLHYDFGMNFNPTYKKNGEKMRPYAKYCELQLEDFDQYGYKDAAEMCTNIFGCQTVTFGTEVRHYSLADKSGEKVNNCNTFTLTTGDGKRRRKIAVKRDLRTHRNLKIDEHDTLINFVAGDVNADKTLWSQCCVNNVCDKYDAYIKKP